MSYVFFCILFLGMCVGMYLSQDLGNPPSQYQIYNEEKEDDSYQDFDEMEGPQTANDCYTDKLHCTKALGFNMPKPICVYKKNIGLTNYLGLCEIKLQNCINKEQIKSGVASVDDEIYHNGKTFDCSYYVTNAKSEKDAVKWYFKLGGRDADNESITASIDNKM